MNQGDPLLNKLIAGFTQDGTPLNALIGNKLEWGVTTLVAGMLANETLSSQMSAEEMVDGIIDLCVFAIGTLEVFGVDANKAWDEVYKANMSKEVGIKEGRPNPLGLPDLVKPEGWTGPEHKGNHGNITDSF